MLPPLAILEVLSSSHSSSSCSIPTLLGFWKFMKTWLFPQALGLDKGWAGRLSGLLHWLCNCSFHWFRYYLLSYANGFDWIWFFLIYMSTSSSVVLPALCSCSLLFLFPADLPLSLASGLLVCLLICGSTFHLCLYHYFIHHCRSVGWLESSSTHGNLKFMAAAWIFKIVS